MKSEPNQTEKQDVTELQETDLKNIRRHGQSNNLPDEPKKPLGYILTEYIEEENLGF
jgi:hypothetical protein